jgi:hypothetical protein
MRDNKEAQTSFLLLQAIPVRGPSGNVPTLTFETVFRACVKYGTTVPYPSELYKGMWSAIAMGSDTSSSQPTTSPRPGPEFRVQTSEFIRA